MSAEALFEAIDDGDAHEVRRMLALEPRLARERDDQGLSALLHACYRRADDDLIDVLCEHAEPLDVFEAAALGARERLATILDAEPDRLEALAADGFRPLHLASFFGQADCVEELLVRGADPNAVAKNPSRVQPLHSAAAGRDGRSVGLLLEHGAQPDAQQAGGYVALHSAAGAGDEDMVDQLVDGGADHHARAEDGSTPASLARKGGHDSLARRLGG